MTAKLVKDSNGYWLDSNDEVIKDFLQEGKLSKENCDEIFGVVDVERLAYDSSQEFLIEPIESPIFTFGYEQGFDKAIELNDKLFTVEDMKKAYMDGVSNGHNFGYPAIDHADKYVQSLQQLTEIEVEVVMSEIVTDDFVGMQGIPKLDTNRCLILRKI